MRLVMIRYLRIFSYSAVHCPDVGELSRVELRPAVACLPLGHLAPGTHDVLSILKSFPDAINNIKNKCDGAADLLWL